MGVGGHRSRSGSVAPPESRDFSKNSTEGVLWVGLEMPENLPWPGHFDTETFQSKVLRSLPRKLPSS